MRARARSVRTGKAAAAPSARSSAEDSLKLALTYSLSFSLLALAACSSTTIATRLHCAVSRFVRARARREGDDLPKPTSASSSPRSLLLHLPHRDDLCRNVRRVSSCAQVAVEEALRGRRRTLGRRRVDRDRVVELLLGGCEAYEERADDDEKGGGRESRGGERARGEERRGGGGRGGVRARRGSAALKTARRSARRSECTYRPS